MKLRCAVLAALLISAPAFGQGVPRIKATIQSFDGQTLIVTSGTDKNLQTTSVEVLPSTRMVREEKRALTDVATGAYVGATVTTGKDGVMHAQEVHIFPEELRGSSEGAFPAGPGHTMIDGTVSAVAPGSLSLNFRGGGDVDGPPCTGRAPRVGGCHGSATIQVATGVPVTGLVTVDKSLLTPGTVVALSVMAGGDGRLVTPGLTIEPQPQTAPPAPKSPPAAK